jgi:hypothetical protein
MTELERRGSKLEAAVGTRPTPEEAAALATLAAMLDSLARREAAGDVTAQGEIEALAAGLPPLAHSVGEGAGPPRHRILFNVHFLFLFIHRGASPVAGPSFRHVPGQAASRWGANRVTGFSPIR